MADLSDRRVLVTGGAGFIGSHLAAHLSQSNDVRVLDSLAKGSRDAVPADATLLEGDVRNTEAVADAVSDVDVVFHQAAQVSVAASVEAPVPSHETNVAGTLAVLEAARTHDVRVVFASSAALYGHPQSLPVDETHPASPTSPYGLDKLTGDHYTRLYADLYGLETVALRYFNAYGPGQTGGDYAGVITVFLNQALAGEPLTVEGDGDQTRDFIFVTDLVQANVLAATTQETGIAFNVGTGESVSILELAEIVREVTDADSEIVHGPPREGDIDHSRADISRAREVLGFEPTVDLRDGLQRTVAARE